jgi:hypothetical protein
MGAGTVTVGRTTYAVGLYWENSPSGRLAQTAKEAAKQPGQQAEFYAIRAGDKGGRVAQFGLGQMAAGHKAGMPAFAGCLANQQLGSWGGAFRMREGTVVTVVRDDLIVPDGDQFFVNENEARDRLLQEIGFGGLQRVYAPESWAISGSDTMPVSLLLDERKDIKLRPVEVSKKMVLVAIAAVVLLLLVLGGGWYYAEQQAEEEAARQAQETALKRLRDQASKANPFEANQPQYPAPERKWEKVPAAMDVINACEQGLGQIDAAIAGWKLTQLKCDGNSISLVWGREKGFSRPPEGSTVNETAGTASLSIRLPPLAARGPENLVEGADITRRYLSQDWPGVVNRASDDPAPQPPPGFQGAWAPPPVPWVKRSFTLTVPELPSSLPVYFGNLPGVIVQSVSYSGSGNNGSWAVEGVIYENRG